jgi:alpha-glucosidase
MTLIDRDALENRTKATAPWWRNSVVYQLYVRSFADSDGDGIGDLDGVTAGLDHIAGLGVDGIWVNPCYPSPNRDGGYDVADYLDIGAEYGGLPAFQRLLDGAHALGLRVLMDLVPNHCSDQHAWFQAALSARPGDPERRRFHFRDGRGPDGALPPNNWQSVFGGPAWTRVQESDGRPGQWYLHSFDSSQPDFDWASSDVAEMFDDVLRTWFDRGIDGFRIDVAYAMVKHPDLPDLEDASGENPYQWNQPGVHDIFRRWRSIAEGYDRDLTLVGEVWLPPALTASYIREGELNQVFYFDLLQQPFDGPSFRASISESLAGIRDLPGVPTWTLNNHDVHRSVSRYGLVEAEPMQTADANALRTRARGRVDAALGTARARAALLLTLALPGSLYLYQGEELGLPESQDIPGDARRDPIWQRSGRTEHGRDGSRIPLPWRSDVPSFGFSPAGSAQPWLPQPDWFGALSAEAQEADSSSTLHLYRSALSCRRSLDADASLEWSPTGRADVLSFRRGDVLVVTVFGGVAYEPPAGWTETLLRSDGFRSGPIPPNTTAWLRRPVGVST